MRASDFFNQHVVFRFNEFKQFMESHRQGVSEKNCHMALYNYCKKGKLTHVRKGLYTVKNDNPHLALTVSPFLIAGKATEDATLAYHTALESHGIAYTDFNEHTYLTSYRTNDFMFQDQHYRAIYRSSLNQKNEQASGIEIVTNLGTMIRRTHLERTLVDVLDRPEISGGWEEVMRSLDRIAIFSAARAVDYALSIGHASIIAKLGYFFDHQRPEYLRIDQSIIERLLPYIPNRPYYIDRKTPAGLSTYIKKWHLFVPNYLHKRAWEEPENDLDH
ncbi:MAG: hypothetical protein JSS53_06760 [Proteobacteria bacterium]|nr:hypothetical protein [Pseudomonadota bacterium]